MIWKSPRLRLHARENWRVLRKKEQAGFFNVHSVEFFKYSRICENKGQWQIFNLTFSIHFFVFEQRSSWQSCYLPDLDAVAHETPQKMSVVFTNFTKSQWIREIRVWGQSFDPARPVTESTWGNEPLFPMHMILNLENSLEIVDSRQSHIELSSQWKKSLLVFVRHEPACLSFAL